jgi:hypothetical protein
MLIKVSCSRFDPNLTEIAFEVDMMRFGIMKKFTDIRNLI